jgi:hypothetical protein
MTEDAGWTEGSPEPERNIEATGFTVIDEGNCGRIETEADYLEYPDVSGFLKFLGDCSQAHRLAGTPTGMPKRAMRGNAETFSMPPDDTASRWLSGSNTSPVPSILGACRRTPWSCRGSKKQLRSAVNDTAPREADTRDAAKEILHWGGTDIRRPHNLAAVDALGTYPGGFIRYIELCRRSFGLGKVLDLRPFMNSGYGLRSTPASLSGRATASAGSCIVNDRLRPRRKLAASGMT